MAKYETRLRGDFDETLRYLHDGILDKSASASYEDESCVQCAGVRCCVRVYERYSWSGGNRLSMTLTLVGDGEDLFLSAITSGGSQGCSLSSIPGGRNFSWIPSGNWRRAGYDFAAAGRGRNDSLDRFDCFFLLFFQF